MAAVALQVHLVHASGPLLRGSPLGGLHAEAGGVHREARDAPLLAVHLRLQELALLLERHVVEGLARDEVVVDAHLNPLAPRRGMALARDVEAGEARRVREPALDLRDLGGVQLARRERLDRQQLPARVLHLALELALPRRERAASGARLLQELLARLAAPALLVDLLHEALRHRVVDGDAVQRGVLRVVLLGLRDELRERRVLRAVHAVGAHHLELVAPHDAGIGHVDQRARVAVQVNLVEEHVAALARERLRRIIGWGLGNGKRLD